MPHAELASLREAVAQLRELPWKRDVPAYVAERSDFEAWLRAHGVTPHHGVEGAYLDGEIRLRTLARAPEASETLAHELVHALEVQHDLLRPAAPHDEADVAAHTLHEGVAITIASGITARRGGLQPRRTIAEHGASLEEIALARITEPRDTFASRFPYVAGAGFAGVLYATGGAAAWTAAETHPPRSLVEILRPKLYLAGFSDPPRPLSALAGATHEHVPGWVAQALLETHLEPAAVARCMDDFRGADAVTLDGRSRSLLSFATAATAARVAKAFPHARRFGASGVALEGAAEGHALSPPSLSPPLRWATPAATVYPLGRDPADAFVLAGRVARSTALGLDWGNVAHVDRKGLSLSVLQFVDRPQLASVMLVRLPKAQPVESGLSLLVQAFVDSEVARIEVHDEPPAATPAGQVFMRRVDTPTDSVTLVLLPRCEDRLAVAAVAFSRELPFGALRGRLADLVQHGSDGDSAVCRRLRAQDTADFTPPR